MVEINSLRDGKIYLDSGIDGMHTIESGDVFENRAGEELAKGMFLYVSAIQYQPDEGVTFALRGDYIPSPILTVGQLAEKVEAGDLKRRPEITANKIHHFRKKEGENCIVCHQAMWPEDAYGEELSLDDELMKAPYRNYQFCSKECCERFEQQVRDAYEDN